MKRLVTTILFSASILIVSAQDSTRVKNRHGLTVTSPDSVDRGVLIDTIHSESMPAQQIRQMEQNASPEEKLIQLENDISSIKATLKKRPNEQIGQKVSSLEERTAILRSRLNETNDGTKRDKWEKDYAVLKMDIDSLGNTTQ